ncbi:MAG: histidinol dehydrogenase [Treponema sp.]|jgi:histidinol dehydrogenase|nr:histidinol dehydrogenase [Treponema sp.]
MKIIQGAEFDLYWKSIESGNDDGALEAAVKEIIAGVRIGGDEAVRRFASRFDKSVPAQFEAPPSVVKRALDALRANDPELTAALELAADHIRCFSLKQKEQFSDFEYEMDEGLVTGQRVIPVERAAIYVPAGRFPLISTALMGLIPAFSAGVGELVLASPPLEDGLPDRRIMAAAAIAAEITGASLDGKALSAEITGKSRLRVFALGGAQAVAALALGTETIPRVDVIAGPGNKYVAAAKRMLFGEVGIDFVAGPTDVLVIADGGTESGDKAQTVDLIAADLLAQAEHDPDARARALVPNRDMAEQIARSVERRLDALPAATARSSLDSGGLIIVYQNKEEAIRIAGTIAPEHLELQIAAAGEWIPELKNYGSLFVGGLSAEVLGDYSAGINHTLPTSGSVRFSGGLSVRHFLKTLTTLRCAGGAGFEKARQAAERIALAEGLIFHAESARSRAL